MFNIIRFLAREQVVLYLLKNVLNLIFIKLAEESVLVTLILATIFKFGL